MTKDEENEIIRDLAERVGQTISKIHQTERTLIAMADSVRGMTNEVIDLFNSVQKSLKEVRESNEG